MICTSCGVEHAGRGSKCASCLLHPPPDTGRRRKGKSAPYQGRSQTSLQGAVSASGSVPTQRDVIVGWLAQHGPATNSEIAEALGFGINVVSARVNSELYPYNANARLEDVGHRACRVTGHEARIVGVRA